MGFFGDYHTHTIFSHGKGTIEENVVRAREIGLKQVAITDHGFSHVTYNVRRTDFRFMISEIAQMRKKYPDIEIFLGLETNFNGKYGEIDIRAEDMSDLDILLCGFHKFVRPQRLIENFRFYLPNLFFDIIMYTPPSQVRRNTNTYIKALERYDIDIITHMNYGLKVDVLEVAKAAKHFGTYIELNGKHITMTDAEIIKMAENGVKFIVNSDAHSVPKIGGFYRQFELLKRLDIPKELIANYEQMPKFRSRIKRNLYK